MKVKQWHSPEHSMGSLNPKYKLDLLRTCACLTRHIVIQELDCKKSWARQDTKKSFDWVLKNTDVNSAFIFFGLRKDLGNNIYLDVCYRGNKKNEVSPEYFIFYTLHWKFAEPLAKRFKLVSYGPHTWTSSRSYNI